LAVFGDHVQFDEDWFIQNIVDKYLKWGNVIKLLLLYIKQVGRNGCMMCVVYNNGFNFH
jgi:hypothetical protein